MSIGLDAMAKIRQIKSDICFLGVNAIDHRFGISDNDWDVVQLKQVMVESAKKTICLTISEKINTLQPLKVCDLKKIDTLVTELSPDDPLLQPYRDAGINVL
jgi:DeoR/GlpR family transcriptional regulator of sugar metabolism